MKYLIKKIQLVLVCALVFYSNALLSQSISEQCLVDLEFLPKFLLENDAGAKDHLALLGQNAIDQAFSKAKQQISSITSIEECDDLLDAYVHFWRKNHISIRNNEAIANRTQSGNGNNSRPDREPKISFLSDTTSLITIPSFNGRYTKAISELLTNNESALQSHPYLIIDVRGNSGGSDTSYEPLLPWIMTGDYLEVGMQWLSTPANIKANQAICAQAAPGDESCINMMKEIVATMQETPSGEFTRSEQPYKTNTVALVERGAPTKVGILMDNRCGSTCEQFLLTARQSFKVKLIGQNSTGSLDYSNMRPFELPSGKRTLMYTISRTHRLPTMPVDITGVMPDILLPAPLNNDERSAEISKVQQWLELTIIE